MEKPSEGGFIHSVKVPRLYKVAAKIVQEVAEGGGSIKQLIFEKKHFNTNALYALVSLTLQKVHEINFLFKRTDLLKKEPRLDPWLSRILVTELVWGKKILPQIDCKPLQTISGYGQVFKSHLSDNSGLLADENKETKSKSKKPRYVRINTILKSFDEALDDFTQEGWILHEDYKKNDYKEFLKNVKSLEGDYFMIDMHVPNLLIFPSGTKFFNHIGYRNGWIILQDKASCLPVHILDPPPGSAVLDMCAAPGMKTTQLAAVLNNEGQIYAVERDERRYESLVKMVKSSGATNVKTFNKDILTCSPEDFPGVEYILVDPSCSGSGMTGRIQFQEEQSNARLERLSGFQIKILRNALSKYPYVKRVVYSTCSVYPEENEDVVRQVLQTNYLFKLVDAKTMVKKSGLNFGSSDYGELGEFCLYAKPEDDMTNGFFVAVFERVYEGDKNQFFDSKLYNHLKNKEERSKKREAKFTERQKEFERLYGPVGEKVESKNETNREEDSCEPNNEEQDINIDVLPNEFSSKKKKNKQKSETEVVVNTNIDNHIEENSKKKKKRKHSEEEKTTIESEEIHRKHIKHEQQNKIADTVYVEDQLFKKSKKIKKYKTIDLEITDDAADAVVNANGKNCISDVSDEYIIKKKKNHKHIKEEKNVTESEEVHEKKKKHKKQNEKVGISDSMDKTIEAPSENICLDEKLLKKSKKIKKFKTINLDSVDDDTAKEDIMQGTFKIKKKKDKHKEKIDI